MINGNVGITNNDLGSFEIKDGAFEDDILTFTGAGTIGIKDKGVLLARDSSTLKLIPYVKGGVTNEDGIPRAIMTYAEVATGAGDVSVRVMVAGQGSFERAIIHADLSNANIDKSVIDDVREYAKINILSEQELNILDNQ